MNLNLEDFRTRYNSGRLKLAFIGMSNIGKSYTAKRLAAEYDFDLVDIDQNIQTLLGKKSMADFAAWQGQPYEAGYKDREAESIRLETKATQAAINNAQGNTILDTAGSVIYTSKDVLSALKEQFCIIHITASPADVKRLQAIYFQEPKPLIWADHFTADTSKSDSENIAESYPALLRARSKQYAQLADHQLSSKFILRPDIQAKDIFEALSVC